MKEMQVYNEQQIIRGQEEQEEARSLINYAPNIVVDHDPVVDAADSEETISDEISMYSPLENDDLYPEDKSLDSEATISDQHVAPTHYKM